MKTRGFTIIETLIGVTLLGIIMGGVLSITVIVNKYFQDGVALSKSQAMARVAIEEMIRPMRHGESFVISADGNTLTLTKYDDTIDVFNFNNGDGDDSTFKDNMFLKNDIIIASNVTKIPENNIFQQGDITGTDNMIVINFGIRNEGLEGEYKEVRISTDVKLRN